MADNYAEWMRNTLNLETEDWRTEHGPEQDNEDHFHTSAPKIIYQVTAETPIVKNDVKITSNLLAKKNKIYPIWPD
jgi:hypothetical protein